LERAIDLDPRNSYILQQIGISYRHLRRFADEKSVLDRALAIDPNNVDLKLEYYTKNSGRISLSAYEKNITDYIPSGVNYSASGDTVLNTPDNGFDGLYGGYQIIRPQNIGNFTIRGLEFDYTQRLSFLPGALKGLTARANYTALTANGRFTFSPTQTAPVTRKTKEIPGMQPSAGNLGFQYAYGKFGASVDLNYTSSFAFTTISTTATATSFTQILAYRKALTRINAGANYRVHPNATVYLSVNNLAETGPDYYTYDISRPRNHYISPMSIVGGVQGRF